MTKPRHRSLKKLVKGPHGFFLCRYCGTETQAARRTFCGPACVHEWKIRSSSGYASQCAFERDAGICCLCGIDTIKRQQDARLELKAAYEAAGVRQNHLPVHFALRHDRVYMAVAAGWKAEGWPDRIDRRWWDLDHITPVVEGGGDCGLDNLRTVCFRCHKTLTKALAQKRAAERKAKKGTDDTNSSAPDAGGQPSTSG